MGLSDLQSRRINVAVTPEMKTRLRCESRELGVSLSELVRFYCTGLKESEVWLSELNRCAPTSIKQADKSLSKGMRHARRVLAELNRSRK